MSLAQTYRLMAGLFVMATTALGIWVNSAFFCSRCLSARTCCNRASNWCPMMAMLRRPGFED